MTKYEVRSGLFSMLIAMVVLHTNHLPHCVQSTVVRLGFV